MAQRILPGAYVSLNDLSQLPEGQTALTVGYVLQANRGPVNEATLVTSPTDFLTKFTFSGKPSISDDPTYFEILKVLAQTNSMYISRAANNPLYGGIVIENNQDTEIGAVATGVKATTSANAYITIAGDVTSKVAVGDLIMISGATAKESTSTSNKKAINGYYNVVTVSTDETETKAATTTTISFAEDLPDGFLAGTSSKAKAIQAPAKGISYFKIADISKVTPASNTIEVASDITNALQIGDKFEVSGASANDNNKVFTVANISFASSKTTIIVKETLVAGGTGSLGTIFYSSMVSTDKFVFGENDLMLITGLNQGAYNGELAFTIDSSIDDKDMTYRKGAIIGGSECTFDTMRLTVINANTGDTLETFLFSRDPEAKTIDGQSLYVDSVVDGSAYIKIVNNTDADKGLLPLSSLSSAYLHATGGTNGDEIDASVMEAALEPFSNKNVPISILGCGCSIAAETKEFQEAVLNVAVTRTDCVAFVPSRAEDEDKTLASDRAQAIVDYKKTDLASTTFYATMYAPHVKTSDIYNSRQATISACGPAIAGWLNVINSLGYPYAYAGPQNGLVTGVTCDWKIGDESGEAQLMNDASINYIAYDGKVGRYYMQCQNTLQVANSSMRNLGAVLNVLDIKEHFVTALKEFLQLPITTSLRQDIINTATDYLDPMVGTRFYNYSFQDVSTDSDIDDNTLRYLLAVRLSAYSQKIFLTMNIVNSSFSFSVLQSL